MRSPKRIALVGATGSIGRQVRDLALKYPERFVIHTLIAGSDAEALETAGREHPDAHTLLANPANGDSAGAARRLERAVQDPEIDLVVVAAAGSAALGPTLAALEVGKEIALATKEVLVMAGELVRERMRAHGSQIRPIDSEHSAIWQCLWGERREGVHKLILTASGGPFLRRPLETLASVTVEEALAHPRWKMGPKVTIDSATMMNKGLEILEAHFLFDVPYADVEVLIHTQSVVHSMVQFIDGSLKAQLGIPDMHLPIAIALAYPDRIPGLVAAVDLAALGELTFEAVDPNRFPAVELARSAGARGNTIPAVLNAANEQAVALFLEGRISFPEIVRTVRKVVEAAPFSSRLDLDSILAADRWARQQVLDSAGVPGPRSAGKLPA
jgi:1-deoxy-D-xylulose-5-phosphate reductoisomerase